MRRALLAIAIFVVVTLPLAWGWNEGTLRDGHTQLLRHVGRPLLNALGLDDVRMLAGRIRYINWIPFVGMMLATPGLSVRRRSVGLGLGLVVLFLTHVFLNVTQVRGAPQLPLVPALVSDTLPFLLWLAAAHPVAGPWFASVLSPSLSPQPSLESAPEEDATHPEEETA